MTARRSGQNKKLFVSSQVPSPSTLVDHADIMHTQSFDSASYSVATKIKTDILGYVILQEIDSRGRQNKKFFVTSQIPSLSTLVASFLIWLVIGGATCAFFSSTISFLVLVIIFTAMIVLVFALLFCNYFQFILLLIADIWVMKATHTHTKIVPYMNSINCD